MLSLAATLNVALVADPTVLDDIDHLASDMQAEAEALIGLCHPSDNTAEWQST